MRIVFFGLGSIGLRHARLIQEMGGHELYAFRSRRGAPPNPAGIPEIFSWSEVEGLGPRVAFITNPTHLHIATAVECARRGIRIFLEKPIGASTDALDELIDIIRQERLPTYVAYVLRFHPLIRELKERLKETRILHARIVNSSYLPDWKKNENHLEGYRAFKDKGGGVILELTHEFDFVEYLFGKIEEVNGYCARVSNVTMDSDDVADVLLTTRSCRVNLHLNFMSRHLERSLSVETERGYYYAELHSGTFAMKSPGESWEKTVKFHLNDIYRAQIEYFFHNVENPYMMNNIPDAGALFRKVMCFRNTRRA